jgi:NTE family protein
MPAKSVSRVAIACQGGGSHTAFTAGVLQELFQNLPSNVEIVAISGTSGGAICAALAWDGLVRGDLPRACSSLDRFWKEDVAAHQPWDRLINDSLHATANMKNFVALPVVSPYMFPPFGLEIFREKLLKYLNFEELRELARKPGAPGIHIGAVEVLTGHFEDFTGGELQVESLLASAAIPELFPAITIPGKGVYWDGLFSQNPPIHELTDHNINELWLIQINPSTCASVPTTTCEIADRRNELSGNLSMEQELHLIEMVNRLLAQNLLRDSKYHPISISRIPLERDLDASSKLDRKPDFIYELIEYGKAKARWFLKDRASKIHTLEALGVLAPTTA